MPLDKAKVGSGSGEIFRIRRKRSGSDQISNPEPWTFVSTAKSVSTLCQTLDPYLRYAKKLGPYLRYAKKLDPYPYYAKTLDPDPH